MQQVLVVDDDLALGEVLLESLSSESRNVTFVASGEEAWTRFQERPFDVLISDLCMPGMDGLELLDRARGLYPDLAVLLMSGKSAPDATAPEMDAVEFLAKPFSTNQVEAAVSRSLRRDAPRVEHVAPAADSKRFGDLVSTSPVMQRLFDLLDKVARYDATVLLTGESGVGKERIVKALHDGHPRRCEGPLISVHCGAIPETLVESELFGHVKGAFTGADSNRPGKFELAQGGTLFLDEIGTMKPDMQVRLLRVLQDRAVTRVGGTRPIELDVRVVAATNCDLRQKVAEGTFREDLFYRLNVIPVEVPPLRERLEDIPLLVESFLASAMERLGLEPVCASPEAMQTLQRHRWPGNVRELENAVEYAVVIGGKDGVIEPQDLLLGPDDRRAATEDSVQLGPEGLSLRNVVSRLERDLILQSLELTQGNKAQAAELLDLKRTTFVEKLRKLAPGVG